MGDIKLFRISSDGAVAELDGSLAALEQQLQHLIEQHLETFLGVRFLASEYSTGAVHAGRIDTLGIDEDGSPTIIEYKRAINENVINQGLFYLDWLMDHRGEFELTALKMLGKEVADRIDWLNPRLICVASDYTKYDEHAVQQINRNVSLIRYRRFEDGLLMLDLVNTTTAAAQGAPGQGGKPPATVPADKTVAENLAAADAEVRGWFDSTRNFILSLGDDVQIKENKLYFACKRIKNFACIEIYPQKRKVLVFVQLPLSDVTIQPGFTRDVTHIGHFSTGNVELLIDSDADTLAAQPLIAKSYDRN